MSLILETPRLLLRPFALEDFDAFAEFAADAEASRFLGGAQPRAVAWRAFMSIAGAWYLQGVSMLAVVEKSTGAWVGRVGPWAPDGWPGTEVAWGIVRRCWNRGYATEAATAAIDWAFDALGWEEVIHAIAPENSASQALARKLGAANRGRGRLPPPYDDAVIDIWGQTRAQWQSHRRSLASDVTLATADSSAQ